MNQDGTSRNSDYRRGNDARGKTNAGNANGQLGEKRSHEANIGPRHENSVQRDPFVGRTAPYCSLIAEDYLPVPNRVARVSEGAHVQQERSEAAVRNVGRADRNLFPNQSR
jgi:hypothetical protein